MQGLIASSNYSTEDKLREKLKLNGSDLGGNF